MTRKGARSVNQLSVDLRGPATGARVRVLKEHRTMRIFITLTLSILLVSMSMSTRAAAQRDLDLCREVQNPDAMLQACNRILNDARQTGYVRAEAFNNRGSVYKMMGDIKRAMADYSEAIRLDRTNAMAFRNRGTLYVGMGDHNRAIADFNAAIALDPKDAYALLWRGVVYAGMGKTDSAEADWREATRLDPEKANGFFKDMERMMQRPN
jgi:tetratricopeptide (TPR) repeat protein